MCSTCGLWCSVPCWLLFPAWLGCAICLQVVAVPCSLPGLLYVPVLQRQSPHITAAALLTSGHQVLVLWNTNNIISYHASDSYGTAVLYSLVHTAVVESREYQTIIIVLPTAVPGEYVEIPSSKALIITTYSSSSTAFCSALSYPPFCAIRDVPPVQWWLVLSSSRTDTTPLLRFIFFCFSLYVMIDVN